MSWLLVTAVAIIARAFYSVSTKQITDNLKIKSSTLAVLLTLFALIISIVTSPLYGGISFGGIGGLWWVAVLLAATQGLGNVIYFKGQKHLDSGTTQVVLSSKLIWTAALSVLFLSSNFTYTQYVGMLILLSAILIIQKSFRVKSIFDRGTVFIALSAVLFAGFSITGAKLSGTLNTGGYLVIVYGGSTLFAFLAAPKQIVGDLDYIRKNLNKIIKYIGLSALASSVYFALVYYAYILAPDDGVVAVLIHAQVVSTVVLASILLGEKDNIKRKILSAVLVMVSAVLVSGQI